MESITLVIHIIAAAAIVGLILIQQGKGATAGASFGAGASQTVFGSEGSGSFFSRLTAVFAAIFFATSFGLAVLAKEKSQVASSLGIPVIQEETGIPSVPAEEQINSGIPVVEDTISEAAENTVPVIEEAAAEVEEAVPAVPEQ
ncbi:preprotein translocase subunit SecG [Aurantivibrio infirmus]